MAPDLVSVETHVLSDWTLSRTLTMLSDGVFLRPNFQRDFVWDEELISELIRSIFLGYHIGSLLLWQTGEEQSSKMSLEPLYGVRAQLGRTQSDATGASGPVVVLDGQQRLTALHYAFFAPDMGIGDRSSSPVEFFLHVGEFMRNRRGSPRNASNPVETMVTYRVVPKGGSTAPLPEEHLLPLRLFVAGLDPLVEWLRAYRTFWNGRHALLEREVPDLERKFKTTDAQVDFDAWAAKDEALKDAAQHVSDAADDLETALTGTLSYKVQFVLLRRDESPERVKDTFMQVNRRGMQLNTFELFSAEVSWNGMNARDLVEDARRQLADNDDLEISRERLQYFIPQLMLLRRRPTFVQDSYSMEKYETYFKRFFLPGENDAAFENPDDFEAAWWTAFGELREGLLALRDDSLFGAVDKGNYHCFALYDGLVPTFAAIWSDAHRTDSGVYEPLLYKKIQQWYWSRVFSDEPYMNAPSDLEWREREANAAMMMADYGEVIAWLKQPGNDPRSRPGVVRQTERRLSPSQSRRSAHPHDGGHSDPGNSQDRADTAVYYAVLNFMNAIGPQSPLSGEPVSRNTSVGSGAVVGQILGQEWADTKGGISEKELSSPFNQLVADEYTHEIVRLGVVPASYFVEIEAAWGRNGNSANRYVAMLNTHCISAEMYDALTAQAATRKANNVRRRLRSVPRKTVESKLEQWRRGRRTTQDEKNIRLSALSAQDFRQFLLDREERFLHEFGKRVFEADLSIGMADRELMQRVVGIEEDLRQAIGQLLFKWEESAFLDKVEAFELPRGWSVDEDQRDGKPFRAEVEPARRSVNEGRQGRKQARRRQEDRPSYGTDYDRRQAKSAARFACRASTETDAENRLVKRRWRLVHSRWFAEIFYAELARSMSWPEGRAESRQFLMLLENLNRYRGPFQHGANSEMVSATKRKFGRDALNSLEEIWELGR